MKRYISLLSPWAYAAREAYHDYQPEWEAAQTALARAFGEHFGSISTGTTHCRRVWKYVVFRTSKLFIRLDCPTFPAGRLESWVNLATYLLGDASLSAVKKHISLELVLHTDTKDAWLRIPADIRREILDSGG